MDHVRQPMRLEWSLPPWLVEEVSAVPAAGLPTDEARMQVAVALASRNVDEGTGGPFGAAVFERDSGRLVAVGVNLVVSSGSSSAHAEMVALACAQRALGVYDLGGGGLPDHELVTSCEPCVMCFGGVLWSGVRRLVCGAAGDDARAAGFDEGPKPADWRAELQARGIETRVEVARSAAAEVLRRYSAEGREIYNARRG